MVSNKAITLPPSTDSHRRLSTGRLGADSLRRNLSLPALLLEVENGMIVKGTENYVSSVLVRYSADIHLYFAKISGDTYDIEKIPCDYSQNIADDSLPMF